MLHALVGRIDLAVEIVLVTGHERGHRIRCRIGISLGAAIGEHRRRAVRKIGGRKPRCKRQRRHRLALQRRELVVDAFGRLIERALPRDRNKKRQLPERLGELLTAAQQQLQMLGRSTAGVGHIDMRIGAIGDQRVGMLDHPRCDVGVQIDADHQRQVGADHLADARQDLAFAIVEMFGDHRAVQVEIYRVELSGRLDTVDHDFDDALERILGDMRRWARAAGDGGDQLPAFGVGLFDEAGEADIDATHHLEDVGADRHRRPPTAMHERLPGRLGGRKGVGLVQEATDGDTGHGCCSLADLTFVIPGCGARTRNPDIVRKEIPGSRACARALE